MFCFFRLISVKIGLLVVATGKYVNFVPKLILSARRYFFSGEQVRYFIFTDYDFEGQNRPDIIKILSYHKSWPLSSMMRFHDYCQNIDKFSDCDYLFACDADMLFVDFMGKEALGKRVGVLHAGFLGVRGTYEQNRISKAFISRSQGKNYFAGGIYGGNRDEFIKLIKTCKSNIDEDLKKNFIAIWHDESHLNRYFLDYPPSKILSPSYCFPEHYINTKRLNCKPILVCLSKNHSEYRK